MTRDALFQQVRAWFLAACPDLVASGGIDDPKQIIGADGGGTRPAKPYLLVTIRTFDVMDGEDEDHDRAEGGVDFDDDPEAFAAADVERVREGGRTATLSVQAFGAGSDAWLSRAPLRLARADVVAAIAARATADGVGFVDFDADGGIQSVPAVIDTSSEPRFVREFVAAYRVRDEPDTVPAARTAPVVVSFTRTAEPADDVDPLVGAVALDLE